MIRFTVVAFVCFAALGDAQTYQDDSLPATGSNNRRPVQPVPIRNDDYPINGGVNSDETCASSSCTRPFQVRPAVIKLQCGPCPAVSVSKQSFFNKAAPDGGWTCSLDQLGDFCDRDYQACELYVILKDWTGASIGPAEGWLNSDRGETGTYTYNDERWEQLPNHSSQCRFNMTVVLMDEEYDDGNYGESEDEKIDTFNILIDLCDGNLPAYRRRVVVGSTFKRPAASSKKKRDVERVARGDTFRLVEGDTQSNHCIWVTVELYVEPYVG